MREDEREVNNEDDVEKEVPIEASSETTHTEKTKKAQAEHISPPMRSYKSPVPYSQRLVKARGEHKYGTFLKMLKRFHIYIPFLEAVTNVPSYAKFLKGFALPQRKVA